MLPFAYPSIYDPQMIDNLFPNGVLHYLAGGLLIGAGVGLLYILTGRMGGQSSFFTTVWSWVLKYPFFQQEKWLRSRAWRLAYALGLVGGGALFVLTGGSAFTTSLPPGRLLAGGVLVGFGARLGGGCTSGHGICGLSSLRMSSLVAVITFLATAIATAGLMKLAGVGQ